MRHVVVNGKRLTHVGACHLVCQKHPAAVVAARGTGPSARYAVALEMPLDGRRVLLGSWCKTVQAAWLSAARRVVGNQ